MTWCLSIHADYRCRHAGACCRTPWEVPVEADVYRRLRDVDGGGRFVATGNMVHVGRDADGVCLFLDRAAHRCAIHRDHGPGLLPVACRMFPRVFLHDARGGFISLSHYCPTAAALLFEDGPVAIVPASSTLVDVGELDGLDARQAWPPLLRPDVLMDLDAYGRWEQLVIGLLGSAADPRRALDQVDAATQRITQWSPGETPLVDAVIRAFAQGDEAASTVDDDALVRLVRRAASDPSGRKALTHMPGAIGRWLAARAFACWIAYQGRGLRTIVLYLRACLAVLAAELAQNGGRVDRASAIEAIRRADLLLLHQADSAALAASLDRLANQP
ncbi:MAG TPA: YkgJ family cysteine cluster protein [Vicinamibacterales bacterium]|nr:YkgJ family cysteine cluster protein [Vicinamibacterales bacterium]